MTTTLLLLMAALVLLAVLSAALTSKSRAARGTIRRRALLSKFEQPMYFRLKEAFPQHVVLAQVAFSALLTAKGTATRNTFDRKVADFVLCEKSFEIVAVIELDDSSHRGKESDDAARDALLTGAGYRVLRFRAVPSVAELATAVMTTKLMSHEESVAE